MKNDTTTKTRLQGLDAVDSCNGGSRVIQYAYSARPPAQGGSEGKCDRANPLPKRTDKGRGRIQGGDKRPLQGCPSVPRRNLQTGHSAQQKTKTMKSFFLNYSNLPETLILLWLILAIATTRPNTGGKQAPMNTTEASGTHVTVEEVRAAIDSGRRELKELNNKRPVKNKLVSPRFGEIKY